MIKQVNTNKQTNKQTNRKTDRQKDRLKKQWLFIGPSLHGSTKLLDSILMN